MDFWTFEAVVQRLIEAMDLWRRSPGEGRWPFAGDAPWHLMTRRTRIAEAVPEQLKPAEKAEIVGQLLRADDDEETRRWQGRERRGSLGMEEVALRDEATEWLTWLAADARKVVIAVLRQLIAGRTNVDWVRVKRDIGSEAGNKGVYRRWVRSIRLIVKRLNEGAGAVD